MGLGIVVVLEDQPPDVYLTAILGLKDQAL